MVNNKILIAVSDFNKKITTSLLEACIETLQEGKIDKNHIKVIWVPGAFELPVAASKAARSSKYSAVICLGCVIKGETPHFDYVCQEAARGIMHVSIETEKPIIFGILTTNTVEQAMARSGICPNTFKDKHNIKTSVENKGSDAAIAALQMLEALEDI